MVRIQLHGLLVVELEHRLVDFTITGRQGQQLIALLALHGGRPLPRIAVLEALWPHCPDEARATANLSALVSKTRKVISPLRLLSEQGCLALLVPSDCRVDSDVAAVALHAAECAVGRHDWRSAWTESLSALFVLERDFMPGFDAEWIDRERGRAADARVRALRCYARACLELGGSELSSAVRSARKLVEANPIAESDTRLLMAALEASGDTGAAIAAYRSLRVTLRDELGIDPDARTRGAFERLVALRRAPRPTSVHRAGTRPA